MEVQPDFKELLELFNASGVEYLIVGGYALAFHGAPRYTGDIDIFVKPDQENALRILKALDEFGFGSVGLKEEDFKNPENSIKFFQPYLKELKRPYSLYQKVTSGPIFRHHLQLPPPPQAMAG